ncbi:hypothetical protein Nepgr_002464 [Nepenthes gracilis]|uniref:SBP-type domain-containing protein n=1 Tax=Nepenthes gracilis TaxID=150966 RepID=A0AAD3P7W9_NEPGR|nr:hypothetical protein Nepgr_002464 [Nepenthes gracilis]
MENSGNFYGNSNGVEGELPCTATHSLFTTITSSGPSFMEARESHHAMVSGPNHSSLYGGAVGGGGSYHHHHPPCQEVDPHLMCLKLGKRDYYFEDADGFSGINAGGKKGRSVGGCDGNGGGGAGPSSAGVTAPATMPFCQVEGCHVALSNAKDYHKRHKVCEVHAKAPKVKVLGLEQRFCQQCSRFHPVTEFDDTKRSCRRRLAGHNERRRKSPHVSLSWNPSQAGRALSLLSSQTDYWVSPADLSSRSSAALSELIAENRAAILARQLLLDQDYWHCHHHGVDTAAAQCWLSPLCMPHQQQFLMEPRGWDDAQQGTQQGTLGFYNIHLEEVSVDQFESWVTLRENAIDVFLGKQFKDLKREDDSVSPEMEIFPATEQKDEIILFQRRAQSL